MNTPLPVVYVQDGVALYRYARLHLVLEHLLRDGLVGPAHLVFLEPINRTAEYGFNEAYRKFVLEEALPEVEKTVPVTDERIALGASLGGLGQRTFGSGRARAVPHRRDVFGGVSSARRTTRDFYSSKNAWVLDELRRHDRLPLRFYTEVGTLGVAYRSQPRRGADFRMTKVTSTATPNVARGTTGRVGKTSFRER